MIVIKIKTWKDWKKDFLDWVQEPRRKTCKDFVDYMEALQNRVLYKIIADTCDKYGNMREGQIQDIIEYKDMQVDHLVPKNRGCYSRWSNKAGKFVVSHGDDSMENYMPSCRSCNLRKRDMSLEQFRSEITRQAKGLLNGKASFQVKMSLAYGLIEEHFDRQIVFYFEKFK